MTEQQKGVITLIKSALDGKAYPLPESFDMTQAIKTAMRHKIIALVYYGAVNCGVDKKSEPMQMLFPYVIASMNIVQKQAHESDKLQAAFTQNGLDHMFMKGSLIQGLYPKPEMRTMGDLDILIRMEQYPKVETVMTALGYVFQYESDHELVWKRGKVTVELHKHMIPTYDIDYYGYFGDGWGVAQPQTAHSYQLSNEDFYVYMFLHMTKHYRLAGIGIKHFVDLWVYAQAHPELDMRKVEGALRQLKLYTFHSYVWQLLRAWFAEGELTEHADYITQVVFENAEYGLAQSREAAWILLQAQKEGSVDKVKRRNFWGLVFPGLKTMRERYKVLKPLPFLLPVFWVVRWFVILFGRKEAMKKYQEHREERSDDRIQERKQALSFVGLEFDIQEK